MSGHLIDMAPCGVFAFADDGALLQVNETLTSVLQYDKAALIGKNVESIFTLPTRIFFQTHFFPLVKMHGHAEEIYITLLSSDGRHLPVLLNAKRTVWNEATVTTCAFIIVPNRKQFEDELVAARKAAEKALFENEALLKVKDELQHQAEKLEEQMLLVRKQNHELQQFSHVVTHSLKEPLRKMLFYTSKLQDENGQQTIEKLARSGEQMKAVVTGLQQYVWLNEKQNQFKQADLNTIIQEAALQVESEFGADVLSLQCRQLISIEGDGEQLQLLCYHLLSNAVKFKRGPKAQVTVSATSLKRNAFRAVAGKYKYEDYIRLEVLDEGIGFDGAYKDQIFELFRKLHTTEGQGLGLALCKKIAENHGGFIEAESKAGAYTKISLWLPLQPSKEKAVPVVAENLQ